MNTINLACFVTEDYRVAIEGKDDKDLDLEYVFNLETRQMFFVGKPQSAFTRELRHDAVARNHFDALVGTPEKLMEFVRNDNLDKASLTSLLELRMRKIFLDICAVLEKDATDKCKNSGNPCLEDGCAFDGTDEVCLNAILMSEGKCLKACTDIWVSAFVHPENRIKVWRS